MPPAEKKRRSRELRGLSEALGRRHRAAKLGGVEEVLVDKAADAQVSGYSRDYTRYYLPAGAGRPGETVAARAASSTRTGSSAKPPERRPPPNLFEPRFDEPREHDGFLCRVAPASGARPAPQRLGDRVSGRYGPGQAAYPYHFHLAEEEMLVVARWPAVAARSRTVRRDLRGRARWCRSRVGRQVRAPGGQPRRNARQDARDQHQR